MQPSNPFKNRHGSEISQENIGNILSVTLFWILEDQIGHKKVCIGSYAIRDSHCSLQIFIQG